MDAIRVEGLTKRFGDLLAVDDVSLSVASGELFGLLGPNGAGKSTLINTLCTLLEPTSGSASVAGHDVLADPAGVRRDIGVVFQEPALDEELTGAENLRFHARLYGLRGAERETRIDELLSLVDLDDACERPVEEYSGGMKRRLEIARGLIHRPEVLFLDEPTSGLDAATRRRVREYLRTLNDEAGVTVVLTTHYMEEADRLCDRIAIVDGGSIVALDSPRALKRSLGGDLVAIEVDHGYERLAERAAEYSWVREVEADDDRGGDEGGTVTVVLERGERRVPALVAAAAEVGAPLRSVNRREPSLETVFLSLTGASLAETPTGAPRTGVEPAAGSNEQRARRGARSK